MVFPVWSYLKSILGHSRLNLIQRYANLSFADVVEVAASEPDGSYSGFGEDTVMKKCINLRLKWATGNRAGGDLRSRTAYLSSGRSGSESISHFLVLNSDSERTPRFLNVSKFWSSSIAAAALSGGAPR